jgi:hypothetical protein
MNRQDIPMLCKNADYTAVTWLVLDHFVLEIISKSKYFDLESVGN